MVNIPANPNALRKSMEAENDFLEAERKRLLEETKVEEPTPEPQEEEHDRRNLDLEMTLLQARAYLA